MKSQSKISIKTPCLEKLEEMIPMERGKSCLRCDRLITDFTNKSDQEILDHIKASNGNICGRFKDDQLNRNLVQQVNPKIIPLWQKVAASLLLFVGVENAQAGKFNAKIFNYDYTVSKTDTDKNISKERKSMINSNTIVAGDTIKVRGRVVDENTNEGIPFATIKIIGTNTLAFADFDGYYSIKVTKEQLQSDLKILIEMIGYYPSEDFLRIYNINSVNPIGLTVNLKSREDDYSVVGGVMFIEKKWWQFWK